MAGIYDVRSTIVNYVYTHTLCYYNILYINNKYNITHRSSEFIIYLLYIRFIECTIIL